MFRGWNAAIAFAKRKRPLSGASSGSTRMDELEVEVTVSRGLVTDAYLRLCRWLLSPDPEPETEPDEEQAEES
jgi:hypothetical protein